MFSTRFLLSLSIEFGPLVLFFIGVEFGNFFIGTALLIVSTVLALIVSLARDKRIPSFSVISASFVFIFGALTLLFQDPLWLVIEYTLFNGIFGITMLVGLLFGRSLLKPLFGTMFHISERGWRILSFRWGVFFIIIAIGNEYFWYHFPADDWLFFRLGASVALCIFGFFQFFLTKKERLAEANEWGLRL